MGISLVYSAYKDTKDDRSYIAKNNERLLCYYQRFNCNIAGRLRIGNDIFHLSRIQIDN